MPEEGFSRQYIGNDGRWLPRPHIRQLVLLEIGIDPEPVRRDDTHEVGAVCNVGPNLSCAVADIAVDRRADLGVAEIEARGLQIRLGLRDVGAGCGNIRSEHAQPLPRGSEAGFGRFDGRPCLLVGRQGPLGVLPCAESSCSQVPITDGVLAGPRSVRSLGVQIRLRLPDH